MAKKKKRKVVALQAPEEVTTLRRRVTELETRLKQNQAIVHPRGGFTAYEQMFFQNLVAQSYSADDLRDIYRKTPTIRYCVDQVVRQIIDMKWEIKGDNQDLADRVTEWLEEPNSGNDDFDAVLAQMLADLLIIDRGIFLKVFNVGGAVVELFARDGSTFFPNYDQFGALHGYVQKCTIQGKPQTIPFTKREIVYFEAFPKTYSIPGFPIIESIVNELAALIYGSQWFAKSLSGEEIPLGLLRLGKIGQDAYERARASFDPQGTGQQIPHKLRVIDNVDEAEWIPFGQQNAQDLQATQVLDFFEKIVLRSFGIIPPELSFGQGTVKGLRVRNSTLAEPLARLVAKQLNQEIFAQWNLEFRFLPKPAFSPPDLIQMVRGGIITPNEARGMLNYDPMDGGDELQMMTPTGLFGMGGGFPGAPPGVPSPASSPQPQSSETGEEYTDTNEKQASVPFPSTDAHHGEEFERRYEKKPWREWNVGVPHPSFQAFDTATYNYSQEREKLVRQYRGAVMPTFERFQSKVFNLTFGDDLSKSTLPFANTYNLLKEVDIEMEKMLAQMDIEMWRYFNDAMEIGKRRASAHVQDWGATQPIVWDDKAIKEDVFTHIQEKRNWLREVMLKRVKSTIQAQYQPEMEEEEKKGFYENLSQEMSRAMHNVMAYTGILGAVSAVPLLYGVDFFNKNLVHTLPAVLKGMIDPEDANRRVMWITHFSDVNCDECPTLHGKIFENMDAYKAKYGRTCCGGNCKCDFSFPDRELTADSSFLNIMMGIPEVMGTAGFPMDIVKSTLGLSDDMVALINTLPAIQRLEYFAGVASLKLVDDVPYNGKYTQWGTQFSLEIPRNVPEHVQRKIFLSKMAQGNWNYLVKQPSAPDLFLPRMGAFAQAVREDLARTIKRQAVVTPDDITLKDFIESATPNSIKALGKYGYIDTLKFPSIALYDNEYLFKKYFTSLVSNRSAFVELPAARAFQELVQSSLWGPEASTRYLKYNYKKGVLYDYGWESNVGTNQLLREWHKKFPDYREVIGATKADEENFFEFLGELWTNYPLLRRKEFYKYVRRLGPMTRTLEEKYGVNYGLSGKVEAYFTSDPFVAAHEIGQSVFRRYIASNPESLKRFAIVYNAMLKDWYSRVYYNVYEVDQKLALRIHDFVRNRQKILKSNPARLLGEPNAAEQALAGLIMTRTRELGIHHWLRPYAITNIEESFAELFAYYTINPILSRTASVGIVDEFGFMIDELVLNKPRVIDLETKFSMRGLDDVLNVHIYNKRSSWSDYYIQRFLRGQQQARISRGETIPDDSLISHQIVSAARRKALQADANLKEIFKKYGLGGEGVVASKRRRLLETAHKLYFRSELPECQRFFDRVGITAEQFQRKVSTYKSARGVADYVNKLEIIEKEVADELGEELSQLGYGEGLLARGEGDVAPGGASDIYGGGE